MRDSLRLRTRGVAFTLLAAGVHFGAVVFVLGVLVYVPLVEVLTPALAVPSWLDIAVALPVAAVVGVVPSSRLRVLPVWLVSLTLSPLRVLVMGFFVEIFAFGPGAYPLDVWGLTLRACLSPQSLAIFACVLCVGLLAAIPSAPTVPN